MSDLNGDRAWKPEGLDFLVSRTLFPRTLKLEIAIMDMYRYREKTDMLVISYETK